MSKIRIKTGKISWFHEIGAPGDSSKMASRKSLTASIGIISATQIKLSISAQSFRLNMNSPLIIVSVLKIITRKAAIPSTKLFRPANSLLSIGCVSETYDRTRFNNENASRTAETVIISLDGLLIWTVACMIFFWWANSVRLIKTKKIDDCAQITMCWMQRFFR